MNSFSNPKYLLFFLIISFSFISCSSDDNSNSEMDTTDDDMGQMEEPFITFDLDGETVSLTNIQVTINGTDSSIREITADFPDTSGYKIKVTQKVGQTGTFQETSFFLERQHYCSAANSCNVNTNTTLHTANRIVANFQYDFTDTQGDITVIVRNGSMDVSF